MKPDRTSHSSGRRKAAPPNSSLCKEHSENVLMSKVEKLKEEIGWLKVVFAILIAIDMSLVG